MTRLYIFPNTLSSKDSGDLEKSFLSSWITEELITTLKGLDGLFCESAKGASELLKHARIHLPLYVLPKPLNLKTAHAILQEIQEQSQGHSQEQSWGLVSDAGLVAVADPGAQLIWAARQRGLNPILFPGSSSITLALSFSGIFARCFSFEGYLPVDKSAREQTLKRLEQISSKQERMILFMETPYRHERIVHECLGCLQEQTQFAVVQNIACQNQWVYSDKVEGWKRKKPSLIAGPAIYLFKAAEESPKPVKNFRK